MQRTALSLALLLAVLSWPPSANAGENIQRTKNYYVEAFFGDARSCPRKFQTISSWSGTRLTPVEQYAKAASETFPECKSHAKMDKR